VTVAKNVDRSVLTPVSSQPLRRCEGASQRSVPLAGNYLADLNLKNPRADAKDAALATRLWAESEKIVQML